jgi:hypothetical protein
LKTDFDRQSYGNQNVLVAIGLVTKNFGHHMLGSQKSSVIIFFMCHCGFVIYNIQSFQCHCGLEIPIFFHVKI